MLKKRLSYIVVVQLDKFQADVENDSKHEHSSL